VAEGEEAELAVGELVLQQEEGCEREEFSEQAAADQEHPLIYIFYQLPTHIVELPPS